MTDKSTAFKETFEYYLARIGKIDLEPLGDTLGISTSGNEASIPLFGRPYQVSSKAVTDPEESIPPLGVSVVLCKYLLMCPGTPSLDKEWVSYKDFKDSAPLAGSFAVNTEQALADYFAGRLQDFASACKSLGGRDPGMDLPYQLIMKLYALPKIPLLILFDDADEEFPAQCKVLFERRAQYYLDPECLAILGMLLFDHLKKAPV